MIFPALYPFLCLREIRVFIPVSMGTTPPALPAVWVGWGDPSPWRGVRVSGPSLASDYHYPSVIWWLVKESGQ